MQKAGAGAEGGAISGEAIQRAYAELLAESKLPAPPTAVTGAADVAAVRAITGGLIKGKIAALRAYNRSSSSLVDDLRKVAKRPLSDAAAQRLVQQLMSWARFVSRGLTPMRSDAFLPDGTFEKRAMKPLDLVDAVTAQNVTMQTFPHVIEANGDVRLRLAPNPGAPSAAGLPVLEERLTDYDMNAVRDTALHWVILQEVWKREPFALDPFAAEYISEVISMLATHLLRRAEALAGDGEIGADHIAAARDPRYVMVYPETRPAGVDFAAARAKAPTSRLGFEPGPPLVAFDPAALPVEGKLSLARVMGAGIGVGDLDADGFPDLYLGGEGLGKLLRNRGGKGFEDVTEAMGLQGITDARAALFFDYDDDGRDDLLLIRSGGASTLAVQRDATMALSPIATHSGAHTATLFDADGDGDLDLYVGYYGSDRCNRGECSASLPSMDGRNGSANQLFLRTEAGFSLSAHEGDVGWALAVVAADLNRDGHADLYVANDFGPNALLVGDGRGGFENVAAARHVADRGSGMNVSLTDLNDDGRWDLFVTNIDMFEKSVKVVFPGDASEVGLEGEVLRAFRYLSGNQLYVSQRDAWRNEAPARLEGSDTGWGWGAVFFDADHDGDEDLYLCNGWIEGAPAAAQANLLFRREGDVFLRVPGPAGFEGNSRSVVAVDVDRDGDLDLVVNGYREAPRLLLNTRGGDGALDLVLAGPPKNRRGIGAEVIVRTTPDGGAAKVQRRAVVAAIAYLGQAPPRIHVGIGAAKRADVTVRWPDGGVTEHPGLEPGREIVLRR